MPDSHPLLDRYELRDRDAIRELLLRDPYIHLYELGDLDPFFFPRTRWFRLDAAVALLYSAPGTDVLLCFARAEEPARSLLRAIEPVLPDAVHSHLSPGLFPALAPHYRARSEGASAKMSLRDPEALLAGSIARRDGIVVPLGPSDLGELLSFYASAYPGNWFDPRMLETGRYYGLRDEEGLVAVAGVHVYSRAEGVGVLGNVATRPGRRGRGHGTRVTGELCRTLQAERLRIGLNVARDNLPAIRSYRSLGFVHEADYEERSLIRFHSARVSE